MATNLGELDIPDHVPPELVRDFDYQDMRGETDVWRHWSRLHNEPDIFYTPRSGGHWVLTRHDDIEAVLLNWQDFSSRFETLPKNSAPIRIPPIEMDGPIHSQFRKLIAPFFKPRAIADLEVRARELTCQLMGRFQHRGECEFVSEFAFQMPIGIFMQLAELPGQDRLPLLDLADRIVRPTNSVMRQEAFARLFDYLKIKIAERKADPGTDMISAVVTGRITDDSGERPLTHDEMLGMCTNLVAAGLDTVAGMMGFVMLHLAKHDAQRRRLVANPRMIATAIEELMRRHSIANISRLVTRDLEMKGVRMKAGDMVLTATSVAGLDDKRYEAPHDVDFDRKDKRSLVFGRGPHSCIGAYLARTELRAMLSEWLKRIPEFSLKRDETPIAAPGSSTVLRHLPLVWNV